MLESTIAFWDRVARNLLAAGAASVFLAAAPLAAMAEAWPVKFGELTIADYWTRAMLPGQKAGGGYVTITNNGVADDRLIAVETPSAARAEIHTMAVNNGVMTMRPLAEGIVIPAGETIALKRGGDHLMFMGVTEPFAEGSEVPVKLIFENAGSIELKLPVRPANSGTGNASQNND